MKQPKRPVHLKARKLKLIVEINKPLLSSSCLQGNVKKTTNVILEDVDTRIIILKLKERSLKIKAGERSKSAKSRVKTAQKSV